MADKAIQDLTRIDKLQTSDLLVVGDASNGYNAYAMTGSVLRSYVEEQATGIVEGAEESAEIASVSAQQAQQSAASALQSASTAQQYSGKPPVIQGGTWWTWNADIGSYEDTEEPARGDVMYATFNINPETGMLTMITPDEYMGPVFELKNGYLEVKING